MPARLDAREYFIYLKDANLSPNAAVRWYDGLIDEMNGLSELPTRFPVIAEAEVLGFPYRCLIYHSHRVIYAVHEEDNLVIVHRVFHKARKPITGQELP